MGFKTGERTFEKQKLAPRTCLKCGKEHQPRRPKLDDSRAFRICQDCKSNKTWQTAQDNHVDGHNVLN